MIATLARRGEERGLDVFIVTADKDARQLISDQVRIFNLRKNKVMDAAGLEEEWGIRPDQVVDFLALTGDTVDNVPGVPGIGEGFAATFLKAVRHARQAPGQRQPGQGAEEAAKPARARRDGPAGPPAGDPARRPSVALDWDALETQAPDVEALKALCTECGFHRFRDELGKGRDCRSRPSRPGRPSITRRYARAFATFLDELERQPRFCIDTETTAIDPLRADLVGLSFCWKAGEAYYLPLRGPAGSRVLDEQETLAALRPILTDPAVEKVGQNIKYDMLALGARGRRTGRARSPTR